MGYAIKSFKPNDNPIEVPMLRQPITKIHQAFKEIKHMAIELAGRMSSRSPSAMKKCSRLECTIR